MRETKCDQTGEVLEVDGARRKTHITVKGIALQHKDGGFDYIGGNRIYAFTDEDAMADWVEAEAEKVRAIYEEQGPYYLRKGFGNEGIDRARPASRSPTRPLA